jgi:folate-binding protein YgfZ
LAVAVFWGEGALAKLGLAATPGQARPHGSGVIFTDPRLADLGARAFLPRAEIMALAATAGFQSGPIEAFERLQSGLGVPSGSRELPPEKAILLENGFEELGAINWDKGCYMGQELTARTRYRGLVRKRLFPVEIEGPAPAAGTALMLGETEAGELRSTTKDGDRGYAMIRIEHLDRARAEGLTAGSTRLKPFVPKWMRLPEQVG